MLSPSLKKASSSTRSLGFGSAQICFTGGDARLMDYLRKRFPVSNGAAPLKLNILLESHSRFPSRPQSLPYSSEHTLFFYVGNRYAVVASLRRQPWDISIQLFQPYTPKDLVDYVIEPLLYNMLKRAGYCYLHSSAVRRGSKGFIFVGDSGSGKSTTALLLSTAGYEVISDDETEISFRQNRYVLRSSDAFGHLTANALLQFPALSQFRNLPQVKKGVRFKRQVPLTTRNTKPTLAALFFPQLSQSGKTYLRALPAAEVICRLPQLLPGGYSAIVPDTVAMRNQFLFFSQLTKKIGAFELHLGSDPTELFSLIQKVEKAGR